MKRRLKFRLHFNRINMQRGNPNVWTVHNCRGCFQGQRVLVYVPLESVFNKDGKQPRAYFTGKGIVISRHDGSISIYK